MCSSHCPTSYKGTVLRAACTAGPACWSVCCGRTKSCYLHAQNAAKPIGALLTAAVAEQTNSAPARRLGARRPMALNSTVLTDFALSRQLAAWSPVHLPLVAERAAVAQALDTTGRRKQAWAGWSVSCGGSC